jgi:putative phosphonate catabolism associated alcohol dehydrogenase
MGFDRHFDRGDLLLSTIGCRVEGTNVRSSQGIYRTAVFHGANRSMEIHSAVWKPVGVGEIGVQMEACTLCGSDLHTLEGRRHEPTPSVLGHEAIGSIIEMGPDAPSTDWLGQSLQVGDRITWGIVAHCGRCDSCRDGWTQKCHTAQKFGHLPWQADKNAIGGLSEKSVLPAGTPLVKLNPSLPKGLVCPANCATATISASLESVLASPGKIAVVIGAGMLGQTAVRMMHWKGIDQVIVTDRALHRLPRQNPSGVIAQPEDRWRVWLEEHHPAGADWIIDTTGSTAAIESAFPKLRIGGTLILVGSVWPDRPWSISTEAIVRRCAIIRGIHNYGPTHLIEAVRFLESLPEVQQQEMAQWVGAWYPLDQLEQAVRHASGPLAPLRVGIDFSG